MSVDTHLKGKNLSPYRSVRQGDVELLLDPKLIQWASTVRVDAGRRPIRHRLLVDLEHQHGPHCGH